MKIIKLETLIDELPESRYVLYLDKGRHFFDIKCSSEKEINKIYRQRIWPFLFDVKQERTVTPRLTKSDIYPRMQLVKKDGTHVFKYIHQIIVLTMPNVENKKMVNHINGNTFDYRVENLEWSTPSENTKDTKRPPLDYDKLYDFFEYKDNL
tara:strand:- start:53 stop:508 length:456 start_codon:yes stop_codon:yes gene_type:complete